MTGTTQCVLIVEDDAMIQAFLALHLESEGYGVLTAASGEEMFNILNAADGNSDGSVDLILLDLNLPDEDGLSLARRVRDVSRVPIIIATARKGHEDRLTALGLGADDYLTKPFDPKELVLRVRNVLDRSGTTGKPGEPGDRSAEKLIREKIGSIMADRPTARAPQPKPPAKIEQALNWVDAVDETPPPAGNRRLAFAGAAAAFFVAAGIGAFWMFGPPQPATTETAQVTARESIVEPFPGPAVVAESKPAGKFIFQPAPKPAPIQAPIAVQTQARAPAPAIPEDREPKPLAEVLGYGWVLETQCASIPPVAWWKYTTHEGVAGFVQRKYGGDWTAYRKKWLLRLAKLQDIYRRNSGAITNDGRMLKGGKLAAYMDQMQKRLDVTICLAQEAQEAQEAEQAEQAKRAERQKRVSSRIYFRNYPKTPWRDRYKQRMAGKTG